jgi:DNA polymerase-3 subunit alpha
MELLENVATKLVKKITIALQLGKINAELTHKLLGILDGNNGDTELFLEVHDPESRSNINLRSKKIQINPTNQLINELEILEKEGSIKFWINNNKIIRNEE